MVSLPASVPGLCIIPRNTDELWKGPNPKGGMDRWGFVDAACGENTKLESHEGSYDAGVVEEVQIQQLCSMKTTSFIFSLASSNDTSQLL